MSIVEFLSTSILFLPFVFLFSFLEKREERKEKEKRAYKGRFLK